MYKYSLNRGSFTVVLGNGTIKTFSNGECICAEKCEELKAYGAVETELKESEAPEEEDTKKSSGSKVSIGVTTTGK